jgi:hypothetical protein
LRQEQLSLWEDLFDAKVADLWEPWMRVVDELLEDDELLATVFEGQGQRLRTAARGGGNRHRRKWRCGCSSSSTCATGVRSAGVASAGQCGLPQMTAVEEMQALQQTRRETVGGRLIVCDGFPVRAHLFGTICIRDMDRCSRLRLVPQQH